MRCSTEGCTADAVRQRQRPATEEETTAHLDALRVGIARANETRRLQLRLQIAELQHQLASLPPTLAEADARAVRARGEQQVTSLRSEHDAVTDVVDLDHHLPVDVAVFDCGGHDIEGAAS